MAEIDWDDFEQRPKSRIHTGSRQAALDDEEDPDQFETDASFEEPMFEMEELDLPVSDTHINHFVVCS